MEKDRSHMTERLLNLTLEIIYLLTGEDYTIMNKSGKHVTAIGSTCVLGRWNETKSPITEAPPNSMIHKGSIDQKILELTNKIIQLLTGEVPLRCQDVTVYFSMEEWEYIEGQQDLYKDVMTGNHQNLPYCGLKQDNTPERCHRLYLNGNKKEDHSVLQENPAKDLIDVKVEEQKIVSRDQQCQEEKIPTHSTVENGTRNTLEDYVLSSSDTIKTFSLQNCSGAHSVTVNVPLILPVIKMSSNLCNEDKCFADKTDFETESSTQRVDKVFSCSECDKCFTRNSHLIRHQRTHTGEKPFPCSECGKKFTLKSNLIQHQRIHTGEKPFPCPECGKCFAHKSYLLAHQANHGGKKPFPCSECDKCFTQNSDLMRHKKSHTGEKPFLCTQCGKQFTEKYSLIKHQSIHTDEKPFSCIDCGKWFTRKSGLLTHQATHANMKLFSCSECGKCFNRKSVLTNHKSIHRREKRFICMECTKYFSFKADLVAHKRIHSGAKAFSCTDCEKCFTHKSNLVRHRKVHRTKLMS